MTDGPIPEYDKGDTIRVYCIFRDRTQAATDVPGLAEKAATGRDPGKLADPTAVALKTIDPAGAVTTRAAAAVTTWTYPVTAYVAVETAMTGAGYWEFALPLTSADAQDGEWQVWWQGTGAVPVVEEGRFRVRKTRFP